MYVLIEMADVEIIGVRLFGVRKLAAHAFLACCRENSVHSADTLEHEIPGTVALAGDDAYSVQVVEVGSIPWVDTELADIDFAEPIGARMEDGTIVQPWDERLRAAGGTPIYGVET